MKPKHQKTGAFREALESALGTVGRIIVFNNLEVDHLSKQQVIAPRRARLTRTTKEHAQQCENQHGTRPNPRPPCPDKSATPCPESVRQIRETCLTTPKANAYRDSTPTWHRIISSARLLHGSSAAVATMLKLMLDPSASAAVRVRDLPGPQHQDSFRSAV